MDEEILSALAEYIEDIKKAKAFMMGKYGDEHFLHLKNSNVITASLNGIKRSFIHAFYFHGRGCCFRTKSHEIDIEFDLNSKAFGFTSWTFKAYLNSKKKCDLEELVLEKLIEKSRQKFSLRKDGNIYFYE